MSLPPLELPIRHRCRLALAEVRRAQARLRAAGEVVWDLPVSRDLMASELDLQGAVEDLARRIG